MIEDNNVLEVKKFEFYIVFMDTNDLYMTAYGYDQRPTVMDFLGAMKSLSEEEQLNAAIPDFKEKIDYVSFDIMGYEEFVEYIDKEQKRVAEKTAQKLNEPSDEHLL